MWNMKSCGVQHRPLTIHGSDSEIIARTILSLMGSFQTHAKLESPTVPAFFISIFAGY